MTGAKPLQVHKAVDECAGQIISFVKMIRRFAVDKDRILRANAKAPMENNDAGWWEGTTDHEIIALAEELKLALPFSVNEFKQREPTIEHSLRRRAAIIWNDNQGWLGPVGLLIGLAGLVPLLF